jgi:hypothetical protein
MTCMPSPDCTQTADSSTTALPTPTFLDNAAAGYLLNSRARTILAERAARLWAWHTCLP